MRKLKAQRHDGGKVLKTKQHLLTRLVREGLLLSAGVLLVQPVLVEEAAAGPSGGAVVAGKGNLGTPGAKNRVITQSSHSLAIDWASFDIGKSESVRFNQPSSSSAVLNRVLNQRPSLIYGALSANGRVFIQNGAGIIFGQGVRVNVGALFATSLNISNSDFMDGRYNFEADVDNPGAIVNQGLIEAASGGSVSLVGGTVSNEGVIVAELGEVHLAAGRKATLSFDGTGLLHFQVDGDILANAKMLDDQVANSGEISAPGGQVSITARAASEVFTRAINNTGIIKAGRIERKGGKVTLTGLGGAVRNSGSIDVSGTSGGSVRLTSDTGVESTGVITANASNGAGGDILIESDGTTLLSVDSITTATAEGGVGGSVRVLGERVGLFDRAAIDVSGEQGGGTALIGGDYQGANASVRNANQTVMGADATIAANSGANGDGGKVILWADDITRAYGTVTARGGAESGDGGFVETSGKNYLSVTGFSVDASATNGAAGTWLLDPSDITIGNVAGNAGDGGSPTTTFEDAGDAGAFVVDVADIVTALELGNNVLVTTDSSYTGAGDSGDIDVNASIEFGESASVTLTLTAGRNITFADSIVISDSDATGTSSVVLEFGQLGSGGVLDLNGATIETNIDTVTVTGGAGSDTVVGGDNTNTWAVTGTNSGTLSYTGASATFTGIESLTGGTGSDAFDLNGGTLSGAIDGGAGGTNTLQLDDAVNTVTVTGTDSGSATGTGGFSNIGEVTGGSLGDAFDLNGGTLSGAIDGGAGGTNTLQLDDVANTVTVTGTNAGSATGTGGFSNIGEVTGGSLGDAFDLNGGTLSEAIDGGAGGTNTLTLDDVTNAVTVTGTDSGSATGTAGFSNIGGVTGGSLGDAFDLNGGTLSGAIDGGAGGTNTLQLDDVANTVTVTGTNAGSATGTGGFSNIGEVTGGSLGDAFDLNGGTLSEAIDGGAGGTNTLTLDDAVNTVTVTGTDSGSATGTAGFSNIGGVIGGSLGDAFDLNGGTLSGAIDGGAGGTNTLQLDDAVNTVTVTGANAGSATGTGGFSNIGEVTGGSLGDAFDLNGGTLSGAIDGGAGGTNTLQLDDVANTVTVTGTNAGSATGTGGFSNIGEVTGGSLGDAFDLNGGTLSEAIDGGAGGTNTLTLDDVTNAVTVTGTDSGSATGTAGFSNIGGVTGGSLGDAFDLNGGTLSGAIDGGAGGTNTLQLDDVANTVTVTGTNAGSATGTGGFSNIGEVTGGSLGDAFDLNGGTLSEAIDGGAGGTNTLTLDDAVNTVTVTGTDSGSATGTAGFSNIGGVTGGLDDDTFDLDGGTLSGAIDGAGGTNTLQLRDVSNTVTVTGTNSGSATGTGGFSNIGVVTGGSAGDAFDLDGGTLSGAIDGGVGGTNTLQLDDVANTVTVTGTDAGSATGTGGFTNVDTVIAGADDADKLVLLGSNDTLTLNLENVVFDGVELDGGSVNADLDILGFEIFDGAGGIDELVVAASFTETEGQTLIIKNFEKITHSSGELKATTLEITGASLGIGDSESSRLETAVTNFVITSSGNTYIDNTGAATLTEIQLDASSKFDLIATGAVQAPSTTTIDAETMVLKGTEIGSSGSPIKTDASFLDLTATGNGNSGDAYVEFSVAVGDIDTSNISLKTTGDPGQTVSIRAAGGQINYSTDIANLNSGSGGDTLELDGDGATRLTEGVDITTGNNSLIFRDAVTVVSTVETEVSLGSSGEVTFFSSVNSPTGDLTINGEAGSKTTLYGDVTMGEGLVLTLSTPVDVKSDTTLRTDDLELGGNTGELVKAANSNTELNIVPRMVGDVPLTIGGSTGPLRSGNLTSLSDFTGKLGIGGNESGTTFRDVQALYSNITIDGELDLAVCRT